MDLLPDGEDQEADEEAEEDEAAPEIGIGGDLFFGEGRFGAMAPPIPEALELYLKMMEGLDLKWAVGLFGSDKSIMDTPLAQLALERGGSLRVGLEDYHAGPSNVEQVERAKELVAAVGRRLINGREAIDYLDIPFPVTRP